MDTISYVVERVIGILQNPTDEELRRLTHLLQQDATGKLGLTRTPTLLRIGKEAGRRWGREPLLPTHGNMLTWLWKEASRDPEKGPVMDDPERDVQKAVAWALREISKKNAEAVYAFLLSYTAVSSRATGYILREGSKKLPPEQRDALLSQAQT